jgi:capsid assembly protease
MADQFSRVLRAIREYPWAILPSTFDAMLEIVERRADGVRLSPEDIAARIGDRPAGPAATRSGPVAILPLHGVLSQRMNLFTAISGGTSTELFGRAFDEAMADPEVQAIVLDVDSPGGSVYGTEELAQKIFKARGAKPIVAIADSLAASAAFWIGSQADQFVASPGAQVGSIGVITSHTDVSKAEETGGYKTTVISIPEAKGEGHPYAPLSEEARQNVLSSMQPFYDLFLKAVARGRGVAVSAVKDGYGGGRVLAAIPAREAGMVDRIETLADVVQRLSTPQGRRAALASSTRAEETTAQEPPPAATAQESSFDVARFNAELELLDLP